MINKVAFTGRETMLTKGLELAAEKIEPQIVVKASSVLPKLSETVVPAAKRAEVYTSPFAVIKSAAAPEPVVNRNGLNFFA